MEPSVESSVPTILWRRLDRPGHEFARLGFQRSSWHLHGTAVFLHEGQPCRLDYGVVCNSKWETRAGKVTGHVGEKHIEVDISVDPQRRWWLNGAQCPEATGCIDLDLNFSPSTNLLPIRRLGLEVGEEAPVLAAWLRFPSFHLEPLDQIYRRIDSGIYRYESGGGRFVAELAVDSVGLVTRYPNVWEAERGGLG